MNLTKNNNAFTLVELIVVIVILAILATIAFLSFSSQSGSARDSTRLSDISSIKKSVEMYNVNAGTYPTPDYAYSYTYSGGTIWNQGTIGDSAYKMLQKNLSKKVVDPLKGSEYDYSLASNKREYQVAGNFENPTSLERNYNPFDSSSLNPKLSALGGTGANVYISGNYNGVMLRVFTGSTYYYVPTPTLFGINTNGTGNVVFDSTMGSGKILLSGINNFANYKADQVYSYAGTSLSNSELLNLIEKMQIAYSGSNITSPSIQTILSSSGTALTDLAKGFVKNSLGGVTADVTYSCASNPGYANASFSAGTPTTANQSWVQSTNASLGCTYACTGGWTGSSCNIPPLGDMSNPGAACNLIKSQNPAATDGVYWIKPGPSPSYQVYCDMTTDGGGWTRIAYGSKANGSAITLGTAGYSGSPTGGGDFSIGLTNYNELIASQGNAYIQLGIKGTDVDGIKAWEIGGFEKTKFRTNEIGSLVSSCSSAISTNSAITYTIYNNSKTAKRGWSSQRCHESSASATSQYGGTGSDRFYFYFSGMYIRDSSDYSDAEIYIR